MKPGTPALALAIRQREERATRLRKALVRADKSRRELEKRCKIAMDEAFAALAELEAETAELREHGLPEMEEGET